MIHLYSKSTVYTQLHMQSSDSTVYQATLRKIEDYFSFYETALIIFFASSSFDYKTVHCLQMACGMLSAIGDFLQTGIDEIMKVNIYIALKTKKVWKSD
jgi:hypothetical protein